MTTKKKFSPEHVNAIIEAAFSEAAIAANDHLEKYPELQKFSPCGFAWVNITPARGQIVSELKRRNIGYTDTYQGGYTVWMPASQKSTTAARSQSLEVHSKGADAFAFVLQQSGITCYSQCRYD
jgi:hypothetical protein